MKKATNSKRKKRQVTVNSSKLSTTAMVAGNEKKYSKVIDGMYVKQWGGMGWVNEGKATAADRAKYPLVVHKK